MTDLFLKILNLSFSATWVVLAVVLARLLLRKAPRWVVCALWAMVALRLIFGGIEAPVSLIPRTELISPESLYDQAPTISSGIQALDNAVNPIYSESLRPTPGASVNPLQVWLAVFANLWLLGMVAMALWAAVSCLRVRRQVRESIFDGGVYLCDRIASPFIFGLFRPKIYLPSTLSGAARVHVLAHEKAHIVRRDHWWKPLGFALLTVNWFNPTMWLAYVLLCRDIEMACDERVIRTLSPEEKKAYSAALLSCSLNSRPITACPLAFGEVGVKQRIKSVLSYKKPAFWVILLSLALVLLLAVGFLTDPLSPTPEIRFGGTLYIQEGKALSERPENAAIAGTIETILNPESGEADYYHPNQNGQAVHLDKGCTGSPIWMADGILYLMEPGGERWLPFIPRHTPGDLWTLLGGDIQSSVNLRDKAVSLTEWLSEADLDVLLDCLKVSMDRFQPSMEWNFSMTAVNYDGDECILIDKKDFSEHCLILRRESDFLIVYRDDRLAVSAWTIESPELEDFLNPWRNELAYSSELFDPHATEETPVDLLFKTYQMEDIALRCAFPDLGAIWTETYWESEADVAHMDRQIQVRLRPSGRAGWMTIRYDGREEPAYNLSPDLLPETVTFPNEMTGTLYHPGDPDQWELIILDTDEGQLYVTLEAADWTAGERQMALTILGTLQLTREGIPILGKRYPFEVPQANLGITLHMENVTPNGGTLVCSQSGVLWERITTGAQYNLERFEDGKWVSLMPESTVWTTIGYMVNLGTDTSWNINWTSFAGTLTPGLYRVSKTFWGENLHPFILGQSRESAQQTCYAEFTIE